jgi:hypothetical protein
MRRLTNKLSKKKGVATWWKQRTHIPMDEFLIFLSHPGVHRTPDNRVMKRSISILTNPINGRGNIYTPFVPMYALNKEGHFYGRDEANVTDVDENTAVLNKIILEWYKSNGCPTSLGSSETCRLIKKAMNNSTPTTEEIATTDIKIELYDDSCKKAFQ